MFSNNRTLFQPLNTKMHGLFYKIIKAGKTSYLYGSLHQPLPNTDNISSEAKNAIENASAFVFESLRTAQEEYDHENSKVMEKVFQWAEKYFPEIETKKNNTDVEKITSIFKKITPGLIFSYGTLEEFLAIKSTIFCKKLNLENKPTQEQILVNRVFELKKPCYGLEKWSDAQIAFLGLELSYQEHLEIITHRLSELNEEEMDNYFLNLTKAFVAGDLETLTTTALGKLMVNPTGLASIDKYMQNLVHARDTLFASNMEKFLDQGNVFFMIGSSHLIGILKHLIAKDYIIVPVRETTLVHSLSNLWTEGPEPMTNSGLKNRSGAIRTP